MLSPSITIVKVTPMMFSGHESLRQMCDYLSTYKFVFYFLDIWNFAIN